MKKGVLRNFTKFTGKQLYQSLFFKKLHASTCNFIQKETLVLVLSCQFWEISKNTFFTSGSKLIITPVVMLFSFNRTLSEKCPYWELFWFVFSPNAGKYDLE